MVSLSSIMEGLLPTRARVRRDRSPLVRHAIGDMTTGNANEKGTITISTRRIAGQVEIIIKDTGMGMPADVIGKISTPFYHERGR